MLTRLAQSGIKVEAVEGAEETLAAADFAGNFRELSNSQTPVEYERALVRAMLSAQQTLKGQRTAMVTREQELCGGAAGTAAVWHRDLLAMGFQSAALMFVQISSPANEASLRLGQTIGDNATQGSATKTGIFVKYLEGTPGRIVYLPVTGTFAATDDVFNYAASQFTAAVDSVPAAAGFALRPMTETDAALPSSVTAERRLGTFRHTVIGARGRGSLGLQVGQPALLRCELQGCPVLDPASPGRPRVAAAVTGIPALGLAPRITKGIPLQLVDGATEYTPVLTQMPITIDNTLAPRATIANNDLADSGHLATRISDRRLVVNLDPEMVLPSAFDFHTLLNEVDTIQIRAELGSILDANGMLGIWAPAAQRVGGNEYADRDGMVTHPGDWLLTGDNDNELYLFHAFLS